MSNETFALFLALGANIAFVTASIVYADFSKRMSVIWMNCMKATIAFITLIITIPIFGGWHSLSWFSFTSFFLSGLIGLNIGDLFLLAAFKRIGPARTLILFGFEPLMIGFAAYFLFDQPINPLRFLAMALMLACLFTFSLERYKLEKHWEIKGLMFALIGVTLDVCGVLLTRGAFGASPNVQPIEGHFWRCLGAITGFAIMSRFVAIPLWQGLRQWPAKTQTKIVLASFAGTYVSLLLYLSAIKIGHLASVASVGITGPMFAMFFECLRAKKLPSIYLVTAFLFFSAGFYVLMITS
jgi:drug/metabolite transporter (DMT)-like permease